MTLPIQVLAPSLSPEAVSAFEADVLVIDAIYERVRGDLNLPMPSVRLVLADDFVGEVERHLREPFRREEGSSFTTSRAGGEVAAKTLDLVGDASEFVIVFNAALWTHAHEPAVRLLVAKIVAHELMHPILDCARHITGVMDGVLIPSVTGTEVATSMARIMVAEYRADRVADEVVSGYITATVDGAPIPAFSWMTSGDSLVSSVLDVVDRAYPQWPDLVQKYREWRLPLTEMWGAIASSVDQTMTALIHAQSGADSAGVGRDLLDEEPARSLRAADLYLGDTWRPFLAALRDGPQIAPIEDFRTWDEAATEVGRDAIVEIWARLGLTIVDHGSREWRLLVDGPTR